MEENVGFQDKLVEVRKEFLKLSKKIVSSDWTIPPHKVVRKFEKLFLDDKIGLHLTENEKMILLHLIEKHNEWLEMQIFNYAKSKQSRIVSGDQKDKMVLEHYYHTFNLFLRNTENYVQTA